MASHLKSYLQDPFLNQMYREIREVGAIKSISVDITHACNIRCTGCYFFSEKMHEIPTQKNDDNFDAFLEAEKNRGTNFITIVGGEPSLVLDRVKKVYDNFWMNVATNGLTKIPYEGFEKMPIGISVWGDHKTDQALRGRGNVKVFETALKNYKDDARAFWYYTLTPGNADEIESVVTQCVENGNNVLFNFYSDLEGHGGKLDTSTGFEEVRLEVERMIEKYPKQILLSGYLSKIVSTGQLFDEKWGYDVCTSISTNLDQNKQRMENGKAFNKHFRAYNADFQTTRRCCTGIDRDCGNCVDVWEHFSWVMLNLKKHLHSKQSFTEWLTSMYLFYLINRIIDFDTGIERLEQIHHRVSFNVKEEVT